MDLSFLEYIKKPEIELLARDVVACAFYLTSHGENRAAKKLLRTLSPLIEDQAGKMQLEDLAASLPTTQDEINAHGRAVRPHFELLTLFEKAMGNGIID